MKKIVLAALVAASFGSQAAVLDFESQTNFSPVTNGYGGMDWSNFYTLNSSTYSAQQSGYVHGTTSGHEVAYNAYANPASILATSNAGFDLYSGNFTAAWNNGLTIQASAVFEGGATDVKTFVVDTSHPTNEIFGWTNLASVTFSSFGGVDQNLGGSGTHFAMDDLNTSAVPEPASTTLLLAGLGAVALVARRRKA